MILKNKRPERIESFLICEKVVTDKSRAGNDMFVAIFRDNLNRKFTHYISFNQRSKVWLYNLLFGSGKPIDFESLMMDIEITVTAGVDTSIGNIKRRENGNRFTIITAAGQRRCLAERSPEFAF